MFYTYLWFREDGTPYYVGKGSNRRAFYHHNVHRPKSRARIFIQHWSSEEEAFEMEKWYIRFFGRKDNGTGILRNLTDGGEGPSGNTFCRGRAVPESTRQKIRESLKRNAVAISQIQQLGKTGVGGRLGGGVMTPARLAALAIKRSKIRNFPDTEQGKLGAHVRWHAARNTMKEGCSLCR